MSSWLRGRFTNFRWVCWQLACFLFSIFLSESDRFTYSDHISVFLSIFFTSVFDFLIFFNSFKIVLSFLCKISFDRIQLSFKKMNFVFGIVDLFLKTMLISGRILELFIVEGPLSSLVIVIIDIVAIVADETINMLLSGDCHSHELFDSWYLS